MSTGMIVPLNSLLPECQAALVRVEIAFNPFMLRINFERYLLDSWYFVIKHFLWYLRVIFGMYGTIEKNLVIKYFLWYLKGRF